MDEPIYKNIIIRTLEIKLAMAENRNLNEMLVTIDVMKDILAMLKEQEDIINQYHKADTFLEMHGWKWNDNNI